MNQAGRLVAANSGMLCCYRFVFLLSICVSCATSRADSALSYHFGTFGFGLEFAHAFNESVTLRAGYHYYRYGKQQTSNGVAYDASARIQAASLLMDWHLPRSRWRLSSGIAQPGVQLRADGNATGNVTFNGQTYSADQLGFIHASFKPAQHVAPYLGVGYGHAVGSRDQFNFLLDMGALYVGSPRGTVDASCGATASVPQCAQLVSDIQNELADYERRYRHVKWWPVLQFGFSMRW